MALLENRIEAFNREGTVHELTDETLNTLEEAAASQKQGVPDLTDEPPSPGYTIADAANEITTAKESITLLGTRPTEQLRKEVQRLLKPDTGEPPDPDS